MQDQFFVDNRADVFSQVLEYLNRREFLRANAASGSLFVQGDRIKAHYASFKLDSCFQPVFDIKRRCIRGHEALLASYSGTDVAMLGSVLAPERLFSLASNEDITFIDRLARTLHTLNFLLQESSGYLHLNVHPHHLLAVSADHGRVFEGILKQCGLETRNIVLEVAEYVVPDKKRLAQAISAWQEKGYHIALDGFGRVHAHGNHVLKLKPDYIKLDSALLQSAQHDARKRHALRQVVDEFRRADVQVIASGIENTQQLGGVRELEIELVQGFLFSKPQPYCVRH